jgi:hypothetical protein
MSVIQTQAELKTILEGLTAEVTAARAKTDTINTKMDDMRVQISNLLAGAGVDPAVVAAVDALAAAVQGETTALDDTIAENSGTTQPPVNQKPTIHLDVTVLSATAPGSVRLTTTVADADDAIAKVQCYRGVLMIAEKFAPPYGYDDVNVPAGDYDYSEKVYAGNDIVTSNVVHVTIAAPGTIEQPVPIGTI